MSSWSRLPTSLGSLIPPEPHSTCVSLPTWSDVHGIALEDPKVLGQLKMTYPRMWIHEEYRQGSCFLFSVFPLASIFEQKYATFPSERALLLPSSHLASLSHKWLIANASSSNDTTKSTTATASPAARLLSLEQNQLLPASTYPEVQVYVVMVQEQYWTLAMSLWTHCGFGVSSRLVERYLTLLEVESEKHGQEGFRLLKKEDGGKAKMNGNGNLSDGHVMTNGNATTAPNINQTIESTHASFNTSATSTALISAGTEAKTVIRRRIASFASSESNVIDPEDVFLFPNGMMAVWSAHRLVMESMGEGRSVCFGFTYCDTIKFLNEWGPGCIFYPDGSESDIDALEALLEQQHLNSNPPTAPPIKALFTETPSNPLLRTANLRRLRALADRYGFVLVVDDTVGSWVNVDVMGPGYADVGVSSLTKWFSGRANVMGGSLILNPSSPYYSRLRSTMLNTTNNVSDIPSSDIFFPTEALIMEYNSRDYLPRMRILNHRAAVLVGFLRRKMEMEGVNGVKDVGVIKQVMYPDSQTTENYELCRRRSPLVSLISTSNSPLPTDTPSSLSHPNKEQYKVEPGFGPLLSLLFHTPAQARTFYDALKSPKGTSFGTPFSMTLPYVLIVYGGHPGGDTHSTEGRADSDQGEGDGGGREEKQDLRWAAERGMEEGLVRVCVGWEDEGACEGGVEEDGMELVREFERALRVVEKMEVDGQKVNGDVKVN